jgi:hypothetical protein
LVDQDWTKSNLLLYYAGCDSSFKRLRSTSSSLNPSVGRHISKSTLKLYSRPSSQQPPPKLGPITAVELGGPSIKLDALLSAVLKTFEPMLDPGAQRIFVQLPPWILALPLVARVIFLLGLSRRVETKCHKSGSAVPSCIRENGLSRNQTANINRLVRLDY